MEITKILIERGYPENAAIQTAGNLEKLAGEYKDALQGWLESEECADLSEAGYSAKGLMARFPGMTYPAALLTLDWLRRDPENAKKTIEKGIR